ncbi:phage tail assembly chaperone [Cohnella mopanensis]|uniref:phage tail assembly chaperone n=1 Tax=Cohnella mopanensis TaxID=2911966 RepID=UPI001EF80EC2|nr:hypothetical protein [Cohnella mopanensis]
MGNTTSGLDALLGATIDQTAQVYIARLKANFTVRALSNEDLRKANERATVPGAKGTKTLDNQLFNAAVITKGCVDPDFSDKRLLEKYEASDASDCIAKALLPGELAKVIQAILDLSGFGDEDALIEDAKN